MDISAGSVAVLFEPRYWSRLTARGRSVDVEVEAICEALKRGLTEIAQRCQPT